MTSLESNEALAPMAVGLQKRYLGVNVPAPRLLYTDRDCCSYDGPSRFQNLFPGWIGLEVRLDIWHFIRRIAFGCNSEIHPLFAPFMSQLSNSIFELDRNDFDHLFNAKREELQDKEMSPTSEAIGKTIKKEEISRHCRRRTRGVEATTAALEELVLAYAGCTDMLGVPLFKMDMAEIYKEQRRHIQCIQDPFGVSLYTQVGTSKKGQRKLPIYRCAHGSTSLESFHRHLHQFIPGTKANAVNFQAYLLDGVSRWNAARKDSYDKGSLTKFRTFYVNSSIIMIKPATMSILVGVISPPLSE